MILLSLYNDSSLYTVIRSRPRKAEQLVSGELERAWKEAVLSYYPRSQLED
jgi:hypothetical protein